MRLCKKVPVLVPPSASVLSEDVTGELVLKTVPLALILNPLSEVMLAPKVAEFWVMDVAVGELIAGVALSTVKINSPLLTDKEPYVLAANPLPEIVNVPGVPVTPDALPDLAINV